MRCEGSNSLIKNLPETITINPSDKFLIEVNSQDTRTIAFEEFNFGLENTLFEDEFVYQSTAINELSSHILSGGRALLAADTVKESVSGAFDTVLQEAETLILSANDLEVKVQELEALFNPSGNGVIERVNIAEVIEFVSDATPLSGNCFEVFNKYVKNNERTEDNYIDVTELVPEHHYVTCDDSSIRPFCAQSAGVYVDIRDNMITLAPTPKAQGLPVESLQITLYNIQLFEGVEDIVDIVRTSSDLFESETVDENDDSQIDVLNFIYALDMDNLAITLSYNRVGGVPGDMTLGDLLGSSDVFEIRLGDKNEIVTQDTC